MADGGPSIADVIGEVRRQLEQARAEGESSSLRFDIGPVELSFEVAVQKSNEVGGGLKIWVLQAGAKRDQANNVIQKITVTISPYEVAPDGSHLPIDIARVRRGRPDGSLCRALSPTGSWKSGRRTTAAMAAALAAGYSASEGF